MARREMGPPRAADDREAPRRDWSGRSGKRFRKGAPVASVTAVFGIHMRAHCTSRPKRLFSTLPVAVACLIPAYAAPCFAELPPAPPGEVQPTPEARQQFQLGVSLLQDPDGARFEDAFKAFMRAYRISQSWKILGNLGLSAMKIERYTDGIEAYERFLVEGGASLEPSERQQIEKDLAVMKGTSGTVTLLVTGASSVTLEDTRVRSVGGPVVNTYEVPPGGRIVLKLASGKHTLVATGEGKRASLELEVEAGARLERSVEVTDASAAPTPVPAAPAPATSSVDSRSSSSGSLTTLQTTGLVVGGVGVAALLGGAVTGFIGLGKQGDLDERCPDGECHFDSDAEKEAIESDRDSLRTLGTLTTAFLVGGGVLTATGVTLYLVGGPSSEEKVSLTPAVGPGIAGLSARGTF